MEKQTRQGYTKREFLCGEPRFRPRKFVDMEAVYRDLDNKMSLQEVAKKHGVSVNTLRRRHKKHQEEIALIEDEKNDDGYKLPPLPPGL